MTRTTGINLNMALAGTTDTQLQVGFRRRAGNRRMTGCRRRAGNRHPVTRRQRALYPPAKARWPFYFIRVAAHNPIRTVGKPLGYVQGFAFSVAAQNTKTAHSEAHASRSEAQAAAERLGVSSCEGESPQYPPAWPVPPCSGTARCR
jgi:hypothetical protein